jgi:hypothetical protein
VGQVRHQVGGKAIVGQPFTKLIAWGHTRQGRQAGRHKARAAKQTGDRRLRGCHIAARNMLVRVGYKQHTSTW